MSKEDVSTVCLIILFKIQNVILFQAYFWKFMIVLGFDGGTGVSVAEGRGSSNWNSMFLYRQHLKNFKVIFFVSLEIFWNTANR